MAYIGRVGAIAYDSVVVVKINMWSFHCWDTTARVIEIPVTFIQLTSYFLKDLIIPTYHTQYY